MFEQFPYADMQQLNLDWIIKIAKDFLDQYTTIQQTITEGLEELDSKADQLTQLLDEWYDTHSEDIAQQLANALEDLNAWYTLHQNYLDETLAQNIAAFNSAAEQKAAETIATIPDDYTELANKVTDLEDLSENLNLLENATIVGGYWNDANMQNTSAASQNFVSTKVALEPGEYCLNFSVPCDMIRFVIDGYFIPLGFTASANGYVFYVGTAQTVGFSWRKVDQSAWGNASIVLMKGSAAFLNEKTDIDYLAREISDYEPVTIIDRKYITNGYFDNGVYRVGSSRLCAYDRFKVFKGDMIFIPSGYACAVSFYDTSDVFITAKGYLSDSYISSTNIQSSVITAPADGFVRIHFYVIGVSGNLNPADYNPNFAIINKEFFTIKSYKGPDTSYKTKQLSSNICSQGMCVINGKIWTWEEGAIKIFDPATGTVTTKTHSLGHCNSVDYDPISNCVLLFASQGNDKPVLYLYNDPENSNNMTENDPNCTIVALYNVSSFMNVSASACFGEGSMYVYYTDGIYKNASNVIENNPKIHKLLLGMGDNDLSADGYGTFISGRTGAQYNGTVKEVNTYEGTIIKGLNAISSGNSLWTVQDSKYNGYLYVSFGTCGTNVLKIRLFENMFEVVDNIRTEYFDYEGTAYQVEPEGFAISENGTMYVSVVDRSTHIPTLLEVVK